MRLDSVLVGVLGLAVLLVVSFFFLNGVNRNRPHHERTALAVLATSVGLCVLPYNKATEITSRLFHLDPDANDLLWLGIGVALLGLGAFLYRPRRRAE